MQNALRNPGKLTTPTTPHREDEARRSARRSTRSAAPRRSVKPPIEETLFGHFAEHLTGTEHEATLNTQYRMLPPIGELVSRRASTATSAA